MSQFDAQAPDYNYGLYDKIGGWLVLPAFIHPVIGFFANASEAVTDFGAYSEKLPTEYQVILVVAALLSIAACVCWIVSAYLASTLNPIFPKFYIGLNLATVILGAIILVAISTRLSVKITSDDYKDLMKNFMAASIWVPYMLFSKRVKATFYGIPMPKRAEYANVNEPLRLAASQRQKAEPLPAGTELTMLQRLGMVLYWAALVIAALLVVGGIIGIVNARNGSEGLGWALIIGAGMSWAIGRAIRYIFIGR